MGQARLGEQHLAIGVALHAEHISTLQRDVASQARLGRAALDYRFCVTNSSFVYAHGQVQECYGFLK